MKELNIEAKKENLNQVLAFVDEQLEYCKCTMKTMMQIDMAVEELFVNIALYAYSPEIGCVTVCVDVCKEPLTVTITFIDQGKPYNPLANDDPDIALSAEERQIGGLGIYMAKKIMDNIEYEYKEGRNILTIKKRL